MTAPRHATPLRLAPEPDAPELAVVSRRGRAIRAGSIIFGAVALVVLFGLVAFNALIVRNQGQLDELEREIRAAQRTNEQLRFEVAELEAPERIRAEALTELGMIEPEQVTYLEPLPEELLEPVVDAETGAP